MDSEIIDLPEAELLYFPHFFFETKADAYFEKLLSDIEWRQEKIRLFGKEVLQPRLTALYANNNKTYTYSGLTLQPENFSEELLQIKTAVEKVCTVNFSTCLLNLYRSGQDSMGWHADDEKELGVNPEIASVSFGVERIFHFKHKTENQKHKLILKHGSLLIMRGSTQHFWKHQLPKSRKDIGSRINLTFRKII
ncbi:alpha-ketoglutarate-dependent dioxygenase AlkB [Zunongwangia sp. F260]|uniref:Alpha-ketoglutarate-dependent dioxygenase AlkB n=1 Tax=Autumnicola lenta TaxID=3075593 RepID=A0ABU3CP02_9FLAO|nr:alpha-ketoglutarate-dependent dioxygenase AlkB [Zunongwangia sp. F260]MDT0648082.1 alpha-ketoglutarate-dependent dioxygenase AlkB [Zunongwangia sp. F260]